MNAFSREAMLAKIKPDMRLTKDFFKNVYSFELDYPGFAEQAMAALEAAGCSQARQYYTAWVSEYEAKCNAELKEVAHWYRLECERRWGKEQREKNLKERGEIQLSEKEELLMKQALLLDQRKTLLNGLLQKQKGNLNS